MRKVVHLGPLDNSGGMSSVIKNMVKNPPSGWTADGLSTSGESLGEKFMNFFKTRKNLVSAIRSGNVDLAHVHVTHSISWWRKVSLIRLCRREGIPVVVHIHSGKFDQFCRGFAGSSVKKILSLENVYPVVLEERWLNLLRPWLPNNTVVVHNFSEPLVDRGQFVLGNEVSLLHLSRGVPAKSVSFVVDIVKELIDSGIDAKITITGKTAKRKLEEKYKEKILYVGWVDENRKCDFVASSDFLLSPSRYEGSSMSIIESMRSGLPCIVSKASSETVGISDLVLDLNSPGEWAEKILDLRQVERYSKIVLETKEESEKYSKKSFLQNISRLYDLIILNSESK